jgi:hypothetical protein
MNNFCLYAWEGIYINPKGQYSSCCDMTPVGKFNSIQDFANSKQMKIIRKELLNNEQPKVCERCWRKENVGLPSSRTNINSSELNRKHQTHTTEETNTIVLWDIRDSNLCNMACRMCGTFCSSMWNQEVKKNPELQQFNPVVSDKSVLKVGELKQQDIIDTFRKNIKDVKLVYWAGGEPLINDTHWVILQMLLDNNRSNVQLRYNTNMLKLDYKGRDAIDEWKKFTGHVGVTVSMDCIGPRAEYARHGTKWNVLENNIDRLLENFRDKTHVSITTSIYTIDNLAQTLEWCKRKGIDKVIYSNVLYTPEHLCIDLLPTEVKQKYVEQLKPYNNQDDGYNQVIHMLTRKVDRHKQSQLRAEFVDFTSKVDSSRNQDIGSSCPELLHYMESWKGNSNV